LWSLCRNPNYLGEFMIYLSFALLAAHWLPLVVIALYMVVIWFPNMQRKDQSLARYPEFAAYKRRTKLFIPGLL
jgi:steroid 5-alpha reductase family enzyme